MDGFSLEAGPAYAKGPAYHLPVRALSREGMGVVFPRLLRTEAELSNSSVPGHGIPRRFAVPWAKTEGECRVEAGFQPDLPAVVLPWAPVPLLLTVRHAHQGYHLDPLFGRVDLSLPGFGHASAPLPPVAPLRPEIPLVPNYEIGSIVPGDGRPCLRLSLCESGAHPYVTFKEAKFRPGSTMSLWFRWIRGEGGNEESEFVVSYNSDRAASWKHLGGQKIVLPAGRGWQERSFPLAVPAEANTAFVSLRIQGDAGDIWFFQPKLVPAAIAEEKETP